MRKSIVPHFLFILLLFILITILRGWVNLVYWPFWAGGALGMFLPFGDSYIFDHFLKVESTEVSFTPKKLIFHTFLFQLILFVLTFWVVSSSSNLFGRGLTLSASFSLVLSQWLLIFKGGSLSSWQENSPISLDSQQERVYVAIITILLLAFGFLL